MEITARREIPPTEPKIGEVTKRIHRKGYRISIITKHERPTAPYVSKWLDFNHIYTDELLFIYDAVPKANYPFDILIDDSAKEPNRRYLSQGGNTIQPAMEQEFELASEGKFPKRSRKATS